jgi:Na+/pantothenate symporter
MSKYKEINESQIFKMFIMYLAEFLAILFYLNEKKTNDIFMNEYFLQVNQIINIKFSFYFGVQL